MVDANAPETIPVGTKITLQNWQRYEQFMPVWLRAAYSREYGWRIGSEPEYTIEVKPPRNYPFPRKYAEDTEKYGGQAKLVKAPTGGYTWTNYVAGVPFPNPSEPLKAYKIEYNAWAPSGP